MNLNTYFAGQKIVGQPSTDLISPFNHEKFATIQLLNNDQMQQLPKYAKEGLEIAKSITLPVRTERLLKLAKLLRDNVDELALLIAQDVAKTLDLAKKEVIRSAEYIEDTVKVGKDLLADKQFKIDGKVGTFKKVPIGVVLAISPFNYPLNLSVSKIAPALFAGCSVVFKPASQGMAIGSKLVELCYQAGFEWQLIQLAAVRGKDLDSLVSNPIFAQINFTGSTEIGHRLTTKNPRTVHVQELGGNDPAIVLKDADLNVAAKEIISGAFNYSGQRCTAIKRVIVDKTVHDELINLLTDAITKMTYGFDYKTNTTVTPLINEQAANHAMDMANKAIDSGAKLLIGGKIVNKNLIVPTLIDNVKRDDEIFYDEQFAPILPVISFNNIDEAVELANIGKYGLQASIFTKDQNLFQKIAEKLEVGQVKWNLPPQRAPDLFPYNGIKESGIGVQGLEEALLSMTRFKGFVSNQ